MCLYIALFIIQFLSFFDNTRTSYNNSLTSHPENKNIFLNNTRQFFTINLSYIVKGKYKKIGNDENDLLKRTSNRYRIKRDYF